MRNEKQLGLVVAVSLVGWSCAASVPPAPTATPSAIVPATKVQAAKTAANSVHRPRPAPPLAAPGTDISDDFEIAPELQVKMWAASPQLHNPTNLDIDHRGRVWVTQGLDYRYSIHKNREGFLLPPGGDEVVILEDTNGDGAADRSKVFVQDPELVTPLGIAVFAEGKGTRVIVSCSPAVHVYIDADGDDVPEKHEKFLTKFGGVDNDHGVHAFVPGPDGRWYFATGNEGPHTLADRDGFTFRKLGDDATPDAPKSDDGQTWIQGVILSILPDGRGLRPIAHNFRNNYEVALDSFGNIFQNDNDDDGNESCRYNFVMPGGSYGYASAGGHRNWRMDRREGQSTQTAHWHSDDPGVIPAVEITGAGAPGGNVIYEGGLLPPSYVGTALTADSGRRTIWAHGLSQKGAGFRSNLTALARSKNTPDGKGHWFRPSDVTVGPDGAIYVADWYDGMVGGHQILDGQGLGRILRIAPRNATVKVPAIDLGTTEGQVLALRSPAVSVRHSAWQALHARGESILPSLTQLVRDPDKRVRARALWLMGAMGSSGLARVASALRDPDADIRLTAVRVVRENARDTAAFLRTIAPLVSDSSPAVRREISVSLRSVDWKMAGKVLTALARQHDGKDRIYLEAIGLGALGKESELYHALVPARLSPLKWNAMQADFAWRLHPFDSVNALASRAEASALSAAERDRAVVALAFINHADAARVVLEFASKPDHPASALAMRLAVQRAEGEWKSFDVVSRLAELQSKSSVNGRDEKVEAMKRQLGAEKDAAKRAELIAQLAASGPGGLFLIGEASTKRLSAADTEAASEKIFSNPDPSVRALASRHFQRPSFGGTPFPDVTALLAMKGDAAHGKTVFLSPTAACSSCHEHSGQGRGVGPALTGVGEKLGREALFDAILNPGAAIAFGYTPWVIMTKDQQVYSGFILSDGDSVVLRDVAGQTRVVPKAQIEQKEKQPGSLMPDNIALGMSPQDLVDLVQFLSAGRSPVAQNAAPSGK